MNKQEYFRLALKKECYLHKQWMLDIFSVVADLTRAHPSEYALPLARMSDGRLEARMDDGTWLAIEDSLPNAPLYRPNEPITLTHDDLANIEGMIDTCYGNAVVNAMVLVHPFGAKVPYMNRRLSPKDLEKAIQKKLTDHPTKPDDLPISEYLVFGQAAFSLTGLSQLCVYSATPKAMTADPRMAEIRNRLVEEGAKLGKLNDPVYIAKIDKALEEVDREWIKGDPSENFYLKDKMFTIVRKRLYGMLGAEDPFGDGTHVTLIEKSLNDGWDITKAPVMFSNLREGSFNRGHQTELGGAVTKEINRYVTSSIVEEDCGTKLGLPTTITEANKKRYFNNYAFENGKEIFLTESTMDSYLGKTVDIRSPVYCKTKNLDYCVHCCGTDLAETPDALGSYVSDIGSHFMLVFMSSMHGTKLSIAQWDFNQQLQ